MTTTILYTVCVTCACACNCTRERLADPGRSGPVVAQNGSGRGRIFPACGMPVHEQDHGAPLTTHSTHMIIEDPQGESDGLYPLSEGPHDVHFATIEEKKRLWLRDALINTLFMASWSVQS
jgi:hypothetical protein